MNIVNINLILKNTENKIKKKVETIPVYACQEYFHKNDRNQEILVSEHTLEQILNDVVQDEEHGPKIKHSIF